MTLFCFFVFFSVLDVWVGHNVYLAMRCNWYVWKSSSITSKSPLTALSYLLWGKISDGCVLLLAYGKISSQLSLYCPHQMVQVAWLFWFSKIVELMDTVSSVHFTPDNLDDQFNSLYSLALTNHYPYLIRSSSCWGKNMDRSPSYTSSTTPSCPGPGGGEFPMPLVSTH